MYSVIKYIIFLNIFQVLEISKSTASFDKTLYAYTIGFSALAMRIIVSLTTLSTRLVFPVWGRSVL